ncbi:MAG: metallophosphoesterase family protein, partial [bacterium]|nr:metallophosphoesterase family protein [bacterium]
MKIGALSDTHYTKNPILPIISIFKEKGVEQVIHCGDIIADHVDPELFGHLPVDCALTDEQPNLPEFSRPPNQWRFTKPNDRVLWLDRETKIYLGHKRFFEILTKSETDFMKTLNEIRRDHDGLRWLFGGHTHHQILRKNHVISCVNPGAVENFKGAEYAIVDTQTGDVTFSRIPPELPNKGVFKVGVISDSRHVSSLDPYFWHKLIARFKLEGVRYVIHCGNISSSDIGRPEFGDFKVYFYPDKGQDRLTKPENWEMIDPNQPVVDIEGYKFCVQYGLGEEMIEQSERDM